MFFSKDDFDYDKEYMAVMDKVYNLGFYLFKNEQQAQDLLQEVYLIGKKKYKSLQEKSFFNTWIYKIAQNKAFDWLRKGNKSISMEQQQIIVVAEEKDEEDIYFSEKDIEQMKKELLSLEDRYRIPLILFYMEKKSYEEISHLLKIKLEIVKVNLHRAKKILKDRLGKNNVII